MTSGKSSQQYLLKVFLSELFLNRTFALIRLNGGSGPLASCSPAGPVTRNDATLQIRSGPPVTAARGLRFPRFRR